MSLNDDYEEHTPSKRYGLGFGLGLVILVVVGLVVGQVVKGDHAPPPRMQEVFIIKPLPVPPPPPPPKPPDPPKEVVEKMIEQTPMDKPEDKPDDRPKDSPSVTTSITGPGNDGFGLGGGNGGGTGGGGSGGGGSRFGWYAGEVQRTIQDALNRNPIARQAEFVEKVRIWADETGRLICLKLAGSTGDTAVDRAIEEALTGLQLPEPPPRDMPMPIVMRLVARRPG